MQISPIISLKNQKEVIRRDLHMNLKSTIGDFLAKTISAWNGGDAFFPSSEVFELLLWSGCDYFELMYFFSKLKSYSDEDLNLFIRHVPNTQPLPDLRLPTIHSMIPRWTATKYHTAPIQDVLADIRRKIIRLTPCVSVYNSNLNPRNFKSPNDPYMLLVTKEKCIFLDINRKRAFHYENK